jgi:hypothetical protein
MSHPCPVCDCEQCVFLGALGNYEYWRCIACGMQFSMPCEDCHLSDDALQSE